MSSHKSSTQDKRPLRPLLPAESDAAPVSDANLGPWSHRGLHPKRTLVSAACQSCRKRKTKCSGTRPVCLACSKRSVECRWEETQSQAIKRKYHDIIGAQNLHSAYQQLFDVIKSASIEEATTIVRRIQGGDDIDAVLGDIETTKVELRPLQKHSSNAYEDFYRLLQSRPEEDYSRIFRLVRSGYDIKSMLRQIREADLLLQVSLKPEHRRRYEFPFHSKWPKFLCREGNPYLETPLYELNQPSQNIAWRSKSDSVFGIPYHGASLAEPLLADARISRWTNVISNEAMLTQLLEQYFMHAYQFFTFFHKDFFLKDLKSGETRFCSALLVNAVLAAATHYHPKIQGRNEPWNTESLCYRFFAETKRLWELEMGESKLTTLQAALVMNAVYNLDGLDKIGNLYMVQAAKIAYNLDIFRPFEGRERTEMDMARHFTAWCLFSWQSVMLFHFYKPPLFEKLPEMELPDPHINPEFYPEIFVVYPESGARPLSFPYEFVQTVKFRMILNDLANDRFGGGKNEAITLDQGAEYYRRLCQWFEDLPNSLKANRIALPSHLNLHLHFQYIIMVLFEPFVASGHDSPLVSLPNGTSKPVQKIVDESRVGFETLMRVYYLRHSFATYAPAMVEFLSVLGFWSVQRAMSEPISTEEISPYLSSVVLATVGLSDQAKQAFIPNALFRLLFSKLPPSMAAVTNQYCSLNTTSASVQMQPAHAKSAWPVNMVSINADAEEQRLNRLLEELKM